MNGVKANLGALNISPPSSVPAPMADDYYNHPWVEPPKPKGITFDVSSTEWNALPTRRPVPQNPRRSRMPSVLNRKPRRPIQAVAGGGPVDPVSAITWVKRDHLQVNNIPTQLKNYKEWLLEKLNELFKAAPEGQEVNIMGIAYIEQRKTAVVAVNSFPNVKAALKGNQKVSVKLPTKDGAKHQLYIRERKQSKLQPIVEGAKKILLFNYKQGGSVKLKRELSKFGRIKSLTASKTAKKDVFYIIVFDQPASCKMCAENMHDAVLDGNLIRVVVPTVQ